MSPTHTAGPAAAVLALALALAPAAQADERTDEAANTLERLLDRTDTFRARFEQRMLADDGSVLEHGGGRVEVARPGRFRWEYDTPYEQLVVTDGERVWMYDADLEQVSVTRVEQALASSPAMLLGGGRLSEGFRVVEAWQREGLDWVALEPRVADTDFRRVVIGHDGEVVRRMELVDALGQSTHIAFEDVDPGVELDDERFRFDPPEGVDVIGLGDR